MSINIGSNTVASYDEIINHLKETEIGKRLGISKRRIDMDIELPLIVSVSGHPKSGKDEFFNSLKQIDWRFTREKFAFPLIDIVCQYAGIFKYDNSHRLLFDDREWKETAELNIGGKSWTPRKALQFIGTEMGRDMLSTNLWTFLMNKRLSTYGQSMIPVITDTRFQNEKECLPKGQTISIFIDRISAETNAATDAGFNHASEQYVKELKSSADILIPNNSTLENYQLLSTFIAKKLWNIHNRVASYYLRYNDLLDIHEEGLVDSTRHSIDQALRNPDFFLK